MGVAGTLTIHVSCITGSDSSNAAFFPLSRLAPLNKGSFSNACLLALAVQMLLLMLLVVRGMSLCHPSSPKAWQESPAGRGHAEMLAMSRPPPCCSRAGTGLAGLSSPLTAPASVRAGERCCAVRQCAVMPCGTQALESRELWWGQITRNISPPPGWFLACSLTGI